MKGKQGGKKALLPHKRVEIRYRERAHMQKEN